MDTGKNQSCQRRRESFVHFSDVERKKKELEPSEQSVSTTDFSVDIQTRVWNTFESSSLMRDKCCIQRSWLEGNWLLCEDCICQKCCFPLFTGKHSNFPNDKNVCFVVILYLGNWCYVLWSIYLCETGQTGSTALITTKETPSSRLCPSMRKQREASEHWGHMSNEH